MKYANDGPKMLKNKQYEVLMLLYGHFKKQLLYRRCSYAFSLHLITQCHALWS